MSTETSLLVAAKNSNHNEGKAMSNKRKLKPAGSEITIEQAIEELSTPTGDPAKDEMRLGFAENMRLGRMQPAGRTEDGDVAVKLTLAGKRFVEQMGKGR